MTTAATGQGRSGVVSETECVALLRSHSIGRVGWTAEVGPQILPVNYVLQAGSVVFRTAPYGALAELRDGVAVAFEVDELDPVRRTGWSVLVQGRRAVADPEVLSRLAEQLQPLPWAQGVRTPGGHCEAGPAVRTPLRGPCRRSMRKTAGAEGVTLQSREAVQR